MSDDVKARLRQDGKTDTFFGGKGKPDGRGHGHVVADEDGKTSYEREAERYLPGTSRSERVSKNDK